MHALPVLTPRFYLSISTSASTSIFIFQIHPSTHPPSRLPLSIQILADAAQAVANAESIGSVAQSDLDAYRADLRAATADLASFDALCDAFKDIDSTATTLFGVGFLSVCALFYAFVANNGLCCTLKCCWNPARTRRVAPADVEAGAMMPQGVSAAPEGAPGVPPALLGAPPPGVKSAWE